MLLKAGTPHSSGAQEFTPGAGTPYSSGAQEFTPGAGTPYSSGALEFMKSKEFLLQG
jgi:hypothetical protein